MKGRFEFVHVCEAPSIEVIEHTLIFARVVGVFVQKGVGGGINVVGNAKSTGNAFAELSFAGAEISLESENEGEAASEIEMLES